MASGLKAGTLLHHGMYRIEKILGAGGFGITYLAMDLGLGRLRAIKEFFPKNFCERNETTSHVTLGTSSTEELVGKLKKKFLKEARNIARLEHHPSIVTIHSVFEENNTAYYVMDYIEGESLSEKVKREGPLKIDKAIKYVTEVGSALEYVHEHRINHLDIKPANIMIRRQDDSAILIDFGLSKQYNSEGQQTSTTPTGISHGYAPIEQYNDGGIREFSPQTDVYSLAATLYYLISGLVPPNATYLSQNDLPFPDGFPESLKSPILKAMATKQKSRHETVKEFLSSLKPEDDATVIEISDRGRDIPVSETKGSQKTSSAKKGEGISISEKALNTSCKDPKSQFNIKTYLTKHRNTIIGCCLGIGVITGGVLISVFSSDNNQQEETTGDNQYGESTAKEANPKNEDKLKFSILNENAGTAVLEAADHDISGDLIIPDKTVINGKTYSVTSIGKEAFFRCSDLTSVRIPNTVKSIGNDAFGNCKRLSDITIPDSVTEIGERVFSGCSGLTSLTIPNSVISIGNYSFNYCTYLTKIIVSPDNPSYESKDGVLYSKDMKELIRCPEGLKGKFDIPNTVTKIDAYAFSFCNHLTGINIPNSVKEIGGCAFEYCTDLTSMAIPKSVTSIGYFAFQGCRNLNRLSILNSYTKIGRDAFEGCTNLTEIDIPKRFLDADGKIKSEYM